MSSIEQLTPPAEQPREVHLADIDEVALNGLIDRDQSGKVDIGDEGRQFLADVADNLSKLKTIPSGNGAKPTERHFVNGLDSEGKDSAREIHPLTARRLSKYRSIDIDAEKDPATDSPEPKKRGSKPERNSEQDKQDKRESTARFISNLSIPKGAVKLEPGSDTGDEAYPNAYSARKTKHIYYLDENGKRAQVSRAVYETEIDRQNLAAGRDVDVLSARKRIGDLQGELDTAIKTKNEAKFDRTAQAIITDAETISKVDNDSAITEDIQKLIQREQAKLGVPVETNTSLNSGDFNFDSKWGDYKGGRFIKNDEDLKKLWGSSKKSPESVEGTSTPEAKERKFAARAKKLGGAILKAAGTSVRSTFKAINKLDDKLGDALSRYQDRVEERVQNRTNLGSVIVDSSKSGAKTAKEKIAKHRSNWKNRKSIDFDINELDPEVVKKIDKKLKAPKRGETKVFDQFADEAKPAGSNDKKVPKLPSQ